MRGGAYIGALKALQEVQGSLEFPDGIYGSSVGAIAASLIAFNVPLETMVPKWAMFHTRGAWLAMPSVGQVMSMSQQRGLLKMDALRNSLVSLFKECGIADIETKRICDAPQSLFIIASNMTTRRPAILTGQVPLIQAILCSCCIPGLFDPQVLYGDVYLDAAVYVRNIEQFVSTDTLVFRLWSLGNKITPESSLGEIFQACYYGKGPVGGGKNVCGFKDLKVGVIDNVTDAQRDELIQQGYSQTLAFLTKVGAKKP